MPATIIFSEEAKAMGFDLSGIEQDQPPVLTCVNPETGEIEEFTNRICDETGDIVACYRPIGPPIILDMGGEA